ncbi:MAG: hypothetical protein HYS55_03865, partial [Candidatus Omnitrophica bacterium]|nr:hypothetical protein [Candidatus Omnitrophota bacterium]
MKTLSFFWFRIVEIYRQVFSVFRKNPTLIALFLWIGFFDLLALVLLFLAPMPPVSYVLAPIIRTFWSDQFLHYPNNFVLLPKLFSHAHFLISTVLGVFVTGLVIKKIDADLKGEKLSTLSAARPVLKYYLSLVIGWLISYAIFAFTLKGILALLPGSFLIQIGSGFVLGVLVQSFVVFLLPAIVLLENGFFKALFVGFQVGIKNLPLTSGLIFIPMVLAFLLSFVKLYTP